MPIHDWNRVIAGIFHHFHHSWIEEIARTLNAGVLPSDYYALAEQFAGNIGPDVLTLTGPGESNGSSPTADTGEDGTVAVAVAPPRVQFTAQTEVDYYARKQSHIAVRHASDDRVIALVEIVSPGNKNSFAGFRKFIEKATGVLLEGIHLLVLDLFPPGPRDPNGIHDAIWRDISGDEYDPPDDKPLTLATYDAGPPVIAYVEPTSVGTSLPEMPLFLRAGHYVNVALEATYQTAFQNVPARWRRVLEESAN